MCLFNIYSLQKTNWSETTTDTEGVLSNGGIVLTTSDDGWMYFINGTKSNTEANNKKSNIQAGIYRVKLDAQGKIAYKVSASDNEGDDGSEEVKEFEQIERVVDHIVGYDNGSIYVFGDYIYYATPCKDVNNDGEMLVGKTEFNKATIL